MTTDRITMTRNQFTLWAALAVITVSACAMAINLWLGPRSLPYVLASCGTLLGFALGGRHSWLAAINIWRRLSVSLIFGFFGLFVGNAAYEIMRDTDSSTVLATIYTTYAVCGIVGFVITVIIQRRIAAKRRLGERDSNARELLKDQRS